MNPGRGAGKIRHPAQFLFYGGNAYEVNSHLGERKKPFILCGEYHKFRHRFFGVFVNSYSNCFPVLCVLQKYGHRSRIQKGAVTMEPKIIIHNDFCTNTNHEDIQIIISAVTELITEAILRSTAEEDDLEPAA